MSVFVSQMSFPVRKLAPWLTSPSRRLSIVTELTSSDHYRLEVIAPLRRAIDIVAQQRPLQTVYDGADPGLEPGTVLKDWQDHGAA